MKPFYFRLAVLFLSGLAIAAHADDNLLKPATHPTPSASTQPFDPAKVQIIINTDEAPELDDWAQHTLKPVLQEWYPKICAELPVEGCTPTDHFSVTFRKNFKGVAWTMNQRIEASAKWIKDNLDGQSLGAIVHEEVHVVQSPFFHHLAKGAPHSRIPGWLLEGSADYIRWFEYEPLNKRRHDPNPDKANYNDSYFTTAHFLAFVAGKYDKNIVAEMNAANVKGTYSADLWKQYTGQTIDELSAQWKDTLRQKRSATRPAV